MLPLVPGFIATGAVSTNATGSEWAVVRNVDGCPFTLKVIPVTDVVQAQVLAAQQMIVYDQIASNHLVRRHDTLTLPDGTLALVLDEVSGGSLAQLLSARGQLTAGETVTTLAPLFRALADLHEVDVVHGDLVAGNVLFTAEGRPLIGDLGVARLLARGADPFDGSGTGRSMAPELVGCAEPSAASDVYAMGALGWFCLTGAPPGPAASRRPLTTVRPQTPRRLAEVLTACLATDPDIRPSAGAAAVEVFDAAPAESVALAALSDPAAEITRRIRAAAADAAAADACDPVPTTTGSSGSTGPARSMRRNSRTLLVSGVVAFLVAVSLGFGAVWISRRPVTVAQPAGIPPAIAATSVAPTHTARGSIEVLTAPSSPRSAAAALLQALVDARALAYVTRDRALLDLVYAPRVGMAEIDRGNIATALKNGGTHRGLSFVIKDAQFLDGGADTARIRATILTPAYTTGQPDGRRIAHPPEVLGPTVFSLSHTPHGWRILALTTA